MVKRPPGELDHQQALGATWLVAASHLIGHGLRPHNGEKIGKDRKKKSDFKPCTELGIAETALMN